MSQLKCNYNVNRGQSRVQKRNNDNTDTELPTPKTPNVIEPPPINVTTNALVWTPLRSVKRALEFD